MCLSNYKKVVVLFVLFFASIYQTQAQTETIKQIDVYAKSISALMKNQKQRIFADVSSDDNPKWREFKSEKLREKADTGDNLNENAYVWLKNKKIVGAAFTFQSPSRDWVHFVDYFYRPNGTLAKIEARLNTFYGNVSVERNYYFDSKGKILKQTIKHKDLNSQKILTPDVLKKREFYDQEVKIIKNVNSLPFVRLVKQN